MKTSISNFNDDLDANWIPDFIDDLVNSGQLIIEDYKKMKMITEFQIS